MNFESTLSVRQRAASRAERRLHARYAVRCVPLALALACTASLSGNVFGRDAVAGTTVWPATNCSDAGAGSLRAAFTSAGDGDEIDLTALTCSTITLTTGELVNNVTGIVRISGPGNDGPPTLTINGSHAGRIFHMPAGGLELDRLALTAGSASGSGGCIDAEYAVRLGNSMLSDCTVTASGADGGGGCIASNVGVRLDQSTLTACTVSTTGTAKALGGAIFSDGYDVQVNSSTIAGSLAHAASADSAGGAIWSSGPVTLFGSTLSGNTASGDGSHYARGGAIHAGADFTSTYSTVADNRADTGGGVFVAGGGSTILIDNTTISSNEANAWAGGLMVDSAPLSLNIRSSTITNNRVPGGSFGGAYLAGAAAVDSTIIAGNTVSDGLQDSDLGGAAGTTLSGANNLIRASSVPVPSDTLSLDPMLGPLQDNGGQTWTHALLAQSPAIDHGSNVGGRLADQRLTDFNGHGFARVVGASADIGAFEFGADRIFTNGFE